MGFFLLGRGREAGELRLISTEVYAGRSEAIEALTRLSGEPGFEHRDAEVFVLDLDTGMPVVLVAPAAPAAPTVPTEEPEAAEESAVAGEPAADEAEMPAVEPEEPKTDAGVWEAPAEVEPEAVAHEPGGLAGALKRAAGALESEGIVAPESIGPAEASDAPAGSDEIETVLDQPWLAEIEVPAAEVTDEPVAAPASESAEGPDAAWPWDTAGTPASEDPPVEDPAAHETPAQDEVAARAVEDAAAFVPDPFEEPATDPGDYIKVQINEDSSAAGRTVVMGAYVEEGASPVSPATAPEGDIEMDSMLADLGRVGEPGGAPGSDLVDLTCEDCVYVNTCPNKEDLDPSKCGNFQWRSV